MPRHPATLAVPLLALVAGCFGGREPGVAVSGRVTYKGKPVDGVGIVFAPDIDKKGRGGQGFIRDGHYAIPAEEGPLPGEFNVMIVDPMMDDPKVPRPSPVPERYRHFNELRVVVPADKKSYSFDFELKDEPDVPRRPLNPPPPVE